MRTITIEIKEEADLSAVEQFLDGLGLQYYLDNPEALEKSIQMGYDQSKRGLTRPHHKNKVFIIPEHMKEGIKQGIEDMKNGDFITIDEFEKRYKKWL